MKHISRCKELHKMTCRQTQNWVNKKIRGYKTLPRIKTGEKECGAICRE